MTEEIGYDRPSYTMLPDRMFDDVMADLSGAEWKVLTYIGRRTFGFRKDSDSISLKQMCEGIVTADGRQLDRGTGLSKASVAQALKKLEELGHIERRQESNKRHGDLPTTYRIKFKGQRSENGHPPVQKMDTPLSNFQTPPVQNLDTQKTVVQQTEDKRQYVRTDDSEIDSVCAVLEIERTTSAARRISQKIEAWENTHPVAVADEYMAWQRDEGAAQAAGKKTAKVHSNPLLGWCNQMDMKGRKGQCPRKGEPVPFSEAPSRKQNANGSSRAEPEVVRPAFWNMDTLPASYEVELQRHYAEREEEERQRYG